MSRRLLSSEEEQSVLFMKPTPYRTGFNTYKLLCGKCEELYYVDEILFYLSSVAMQKGLDNPFRCGACEDGFNRASPPRSH